MWSAMYRGQLEARTKMTPERRELDLWVAGRERGGSRIEGYE